MVMRRIDYKWVMLALVSSDYFLAQGTRQIYNSVLPQIKEDFLAYGVTDTQLGIVGSAFALIPPANSSLIGQFHVETRGTAFSICQMCIYVGTVVCSCAAGWLASLGRSQGLTMTEMPLGMTVSALLPRACAMSSASSRVEA